MSSTHWEIFQTLCQNTIFWQDIFNLYLILLASLLLDYLFQYYFINFINPCSHSWKIFLLPSFFIPSCSFMMDIQSSCCIASFWSFFMFVGFLNCLISWLSLHIYKEKHTPIYLDSHRFFFPAWRVPSERSG